MAKGVNFEVELDPSPGGSCDGRPFASGEGAAPRPTSEPESPPRSAGGLQDPGTEIPSCFLGPQRQAGTSPVDESQRRRKTVSQKSEDVVQFHDSDSEEDVYDLFNACNGILVDGFLDGNMLDELSLEEKEALNVPRLRKIWDHTRTGCPHCAAIVETLTLIRGTLRERGAESDERPSKLGDVNSKDSITRRVRQKDDND
jgi:hypothetical protein